MYYHGDIRLESTIHIKFYLGDLGSTVGGGVNVGLPTALLGTPVVSAYPANSTTQITAGITLTASFDSVTALNNVTVAATAANGYAAGTDYALVLTAGTIDSLSVVGMVIGSFSIENRSAVMPTTAGRTLDVSAGGEAGIDLDNTSGTLGAAEIPNLDAAVTTRATPAQVNTEVLDCLVTDTHAELAAVPAATSSLKDKINWLFALARNRLTQTSTTQTLRNDADSGSIATAAVADDLTTASRAEWS